MSWLRLDDGFDTHRKILALGTDERRWTWQRILLYTCRHRSDVVPKNVREVVPKATPKFVKTCIELGLLDVDEDGILRVHDWIIYNGDTLEAKVSAFLAQNPEASANEVQRAIGGKRELVLHIVAQLKAGSPQVPPAVPGNRFPSGSPAGTQVVHARANPSPEDLPKAVTSTSNPEPDEANGLESHEEDEDPAALWELVDQTARNLRSI